jgi:energy-coupling factor transporter ATP-binding protein EcfA2
MITRIFIDNFRCFTNFEARPERINLLIGANGTGKSAFVEVLHRVVGLSAMSESVEESFPAETYTRWDKRSVQRIEIDVSGGAGTYQYSLTLSRDLDHGGVAVEREVVRYAPISVDGGRTAVSKRGKATGKKAIAPDVLRVAMRGANQGPDMVGLPIIGREEMLRIASRGAAGSKPVESGPRTLFMYEGGAVQLYDNDGNSGARFPFRGDRSFLAST